MKKIKGFKWIKKTIIVCISILVIIMSMPMKSKATIIEDFFSLFAYIGDVPMWLGNVLLDPYETNDSYYEYNVEGSNWGLSDSGGLRNFSVTPYDIFTSGMLVEELDDNGNGTGTYYTKLPVLACNFFDSSLDNASESGDSQKWYWKIIGWTADKTTDHVTSATIKTAKTNSQEILRPVIASVYKSLRNLCIIIMMLVLLYIGIRIIISVSSKDTSKYKQMLVDWLVGMCLLFFMHYIMSGIMNLNQIMIEMLSNDEGDSYYISLGTQDGITNSWSDAFEDSSEFAKLHLDIPDGGGRFTYNEDDNTITVDTRKDWGDNGTVKISAVLEEPDTSGEKAKNFLIDSFTPGSGLLGAVVELLKGDDANAAVYKCNIAEYARTISDFGSRYITIIANGDAIKDTTVSSDDSGSSSDLIVVGYITLYLIIVAETIKFLITYIKRVFMLALYTMIAPLVALMYPIDKIGDGKAQAFNTWFKDYLYNVMIQPLHLLLYTVFIVAASELFSQNIIYAIAIYAMMIPSEKYFKKILGFDKGGSGAPGFSPMGNALAMDTFGKLTGIGPGGHRGGGGAGGGSGAGGGKKPGIKLSKRKADRTGGGAPGAAGDSAGVGGGISGSDGSSSVGGIGKRNPNSRGGNANGGSNGNANGSGKRTPSVNNGRNHTILNTGRAIGRLGKKKFTKAMTGDSNTRFSGNKLGYLKDFATKGAGRTIARTASKGALGAGLAVAGGMFGVASAAVSGNPGDVLKGVSTGALAGLNKGGAMFDSVTGKIGDIANERATFDEAYQDKLNIKKERDAFADQNLTNEQIETMEKFAPYTSFDGNMDKLDAINDLKGQFHSGNSEKDIGDTLALSKIATKFGNANDKQDKIKEAIKKEFNLSDGDANLQAYLDAATKYYNDVN